jgi:hypothetical protein
MQIYELASENDEVYFNNFHGERKYIGDLSQIL